MADELSNVLGAVADGVGLIGVPVKAIQAWRRRDETRNLLSEVQAKLDERWHDTETRRDVYEQLARHVVTPDLWPSFRAVADGDADALQDVESYLASNLGTESRAGSKEVASVVVDALAAHVGRAQKSAQAAVDVVGRLRHTQTERRFDALDDRLDHFSSELKEAVQPRIEVRPVWLALDAAPSAARRALERLGASSPGELSRLTSEVGTPPDSGRAAALLDHPPDWVTSGSASLMRALARLAELDGHWESAIRGWHAAADRTSGSERADVFARGAVAAGVIGDDASRSTFLEEARRINDKSPRLLLEEFDHEADPDTQLAALAQIETDDEELASLVTAHRALALLRKPDIGAAEQAIEETATYAPDAVAPRALRINLAVQRGRLTASQGEPIDGPELRRAMQDARSLRDELLDQRRFGESVRILMLAIDAALMSSHYTRAVDLLGDVRPEEIATAEGSEVLAEAAIRAGEYRRALEILDDHNGTPGLRRQRATAEAYVGNSETVLAALGTLDEIASGSDQESELAAFARLALLSTKQWLPWSDVAEQALLRAGHERAVVLTKSMQKARQTRFYDAEKLLEPHLAHLWAREHLLRVARLRGNRSLVREAADAVLHAAPDQTGRLECGLAYGWLGDLEDAQREVWAVARDPSAPAQVRRRAFRALLRTLLRMVPPAHAEAKTALDQWRKVFPGDPDAASWDVVIASQELAATRGR